jgi:hypothetical protein
MTRGGRRHRRLRMPATGLPDSVVERIVLDTIAEYGWLNLDVAIQRLAVERLKRYFGVERDPRIVVWPFPAAQSTAPSGAA